MKTKRNYQILLIVVALLIGGGVLTMSTRAKTTAAPGAAPPADVEVAAVRQRDLPIERQWVGTLDGMVNAAIKAQVSGYLLAQSHPEGTFVRKGQLLFE